MKEPADFLQINLLGESEQQLRISKVLAAMSADGITAALVRSNANLYYLTGRVFRGYIYIDGSDASPLYFVRRPSTLRCRQADRLHHIRRLDDMAAVLQAKGVCLDAIAFETDSLPYSEVARLSALFGQTQVPTGVSAALCAARAVKTDAELELIRLSGRRQTLVYERIPHLYQEGMTDIEFQIEIERASRLGGCLGQFRIGGSEMEIFMGNVLTGENADTPSPYDFAMGGEGLDPSLPVGANGTIIKPGIPVMVDVNGNYTGYMTDMTRCYYTGALADTVVKANALSAYICNQLALMMIPGAAAADLYNKALAIAERAGMADFFMGHRYHAGFVGHGVGIEINELPVLAPRSRDVIAEGNVIAVEPKFVIPGIGAVGIENTYIVGRDGGELITTAPQVPIQLL